MKSLERLLQDSFRRVASQFEASPPSARLTVGCQDARFIQRRPRHLIGAVGAVALLTIGGGLWLVESLGVRETSSQSSRRGGAAPSIPPSAASSGPSTRLPTVIQSSTPNSGDPSVTTATPLLSDQNPGAFFQIQTHCGVNGAIIDGHWWAADPALTNGEGSPPTGWADPVQSGNLERLDLDTAIFRANAGLVVTLRRTGANVPPQPCI